jgi:hypothetical protein
MESKPKHQTTQHVHHPGDKQSTHHLLTTILPQVPPVVHTQPTPTSTCPNNVRPYRCKHATQSAMEAYNMHTHVSEDRTQSMEYNSSTALNRT